MAHEVMTAADAVFLRIETQHEPQHVGSLSIFEGDALRDDDGAIRIDDLRAHVMRRLHRVPRMRHRIMEVPLAQGRPVWVDDDRFDVEHHVRLTSIPRPGTRAQLLDLMSRVQAIALDRARPLWEMWFIDGLEDGSVAMMLKTHHALGDGIANVDLALALVDVERDPEPDEEPPAWTPRPAPSPSALLADALVAQARRPMKIGKAAVDTIRDPRPAIDATTSVVKTVRDFVSKPDPAPWNVPVGSQRRWVCADVKMGTIRGVREQHEATINDVVLAACAGALRTYLAEHGDPDHRLDDEASPLKAMVPVSLRRDDERGDTLGNLISLVLVDLPIGVEDPVSRLEAIHTQTTELKGSTMVDGAKTILELTDGIPSVARQLTNFVSRQIPMNLVVTNVPGPPMPLYFQGARLLETYPYVEVIDNEGLTIAVVSYDDHMFFGITADRDVLPDVGHLAELIGHEFDVLADA